MPVAVLVWIAFVSTRLIQDSDYWTHLALGRELAATFSEKLDAIQWFFSSDNVQWPFRLVLFAVESIGSHELVSLLVTLGAVVIFLPLVWRLLHENRGNSIFVPTAFLVMVVVAARFRFLPRPELLAYILWSASLGLVFSWRDRPSTRKLLFILTLLMVWRFVHRTFYAGAPVILVLVSAQYAWRHCHRLWHGRRRWLLLGAALGVVALILVMSGTYVISLVTMLLNGGMLTGITEMRPTWEFPSVLIPYLLATTLGSFLAGLAEPARWLRIGLVVAVSLAGLLIVRTVPLALIFVAHLGLDGYLGRPRQVGIRLYRIQVAAALLLLVLVGWREVRDPESPWGLGVVWPLFPQHAAEFVQRNQLPEPVFNNIDCGGYLLWAWPVSPVPFIDGRLGLPEKVAAIRSIMEGDQYVPRLAAYGIRTILIQPFYMNSGRLYPVVTRLLLDPNWALVDASDALVFVAKAASGGLPALPPEAGWRLVLRQADALDQYNSDMTHLDFTRGMAALGLGDVPLARRYFQDGFLAHPEHSNYYMPFRNL